ncbi:N-acetylneuraminate lyase [Enterococcus sp. DIV0421]|uniref:dihydrodipicolinate synthase family protein n=1 Tax=Enterococcus sp. DIV0421 TaxID=2774688 RepID=UPI003F20F52B
MRDLSKYFGVIPAFYACYDDTGKVSPERVRRLTYFFIKKGVKGLYINGSSGECIYQSVEDRKMVLENVMDIAKGKLTIINHVACNNTKDSVELAKHSEILGVDAIAAIPPIYFRLPEHSICKYWNEISDSAPNTDFIIYNIPQLAGISLTSSLYQEMLKNPRVIGVKNSSMSVQDIQTFISIAGNNCVVFNGPDEQFISGRLMGAVGGIGGTYGVMPELFLKLDNLLLNKEWNQAKKLQYRINDIISLMCSGEGHMYAIIKEILKLNEGLELGSVRKPLASVTIADNEIVICGAKLIRDAIEEFCK